MEMNTTDIWTVIIMFILVAQEWVEGLRRREMALTMKSNSTKREKGNVIENSYYTGRYMAKQMF